MFKFSFEMTHLNFRPKDKSENERPIRPKPPILPKPTNLERNVRFTLYFNNFAFRAA